MGKYTDIFEKYNEEQLQRSPRVDEPEPALKDDAQPQSPTTQPLNAYKSPAPEATTAQVYPKEPTYNFQLNPLDSETKSRKIPETATEPVSLKKPTYHFQLKTSQSASKNKKAPEAEKVSAPPKKPTLNFQPKPLQQSPIQKTTSKANAATSTKNKTTTQKHPPPVKMQPPVNGAAAGKKTSPVPKIETTEPAPRLGKSPVQKSVPYANGHNIDAGLISVLKPYSLETDLFKTLRGKILFPVSGEPPRSLMVTSAVPGEGKTYIASNLAVSLAQNIAEYVLLLDGDLRRPRLHKIFGFNQVKGLSDHLSNGTGLSDLLLKTVVDKLTLLPAGTPPLNPSEILSSAKMAHLIDEVKTRYDDRYLIIDSPPPMMAPETSAIAKRVDGIIIVIKFGETPLKLIEEMMESLDKEKIIGAVINRFDMRSPGYYRYKKYRRYYQTLTINDH